MDAKQAEAIISSIVKELFDENVQITSNLPLIGAESPFDSMKLVELCLSLEDTAEDYDFEFNWASSVTMSKSKSMFRSIEALSTEFAKQSEC